MIFLKKINNMLQPKPSDHVIIYSLKALKNRYTADNLGQLGGQLAYFFILSLFPFLMLVNQMISKYNYSIAAILDEFDSFFPPNVIAIVEGYLDQLSTSQSTSLLTFGAISTVYLASKAISSLIYSLHRAFRVEEPLSFQKNIIGVLFTAIIIILIFVSLLFSSLSQGIFSRILNFLNLSQDFGPIWELMRWSIPFAGIVLATMALYNVIPNKDFPRRFTLVGAIFSVVIWILMSIGLSYYTSNFGRYSLVYGSLGAIMIMLLYLYWSGIIIVLGGEFAHILAMRSEKNYQYDVPKQYLPTNLSIQQLDQDNLKEAEFPAIIITQQPKE